jgi:hypothetical protein
MLIVSRFYTHVLVLLFDFVGVFSKSFKLMVDFILFVMCSIHFIFYSISISKVFFQYFKRVIIIESKLNIFRNCQKLNVVATQTFAKSRALKEIIVFGLISYAIHELLKVLGICIGSIVSNVYTFILFLNFVDNT